MSELASLPLEFWVGVTALLGLLVGSFLNVVIYRLPIMLEHAWREEARDHLQIESPAVPSITLAFPPSACPACGSRITVLQNIPVISWIIQRGRCVACESSISFQYPAVELLTAVLSGICALQFGFTVILPFVLLLTWGLIALAFIDAKTLLLPDVLTLGLLWITLVAAALGIGIDARDAILGAAIGYGLLRAVYHLFKWVTGKEGIGFGDFKLMAVFGAWLGPEAIPMILVAASLLGLAWAGTRALVDRQKSREPLPFGPSIALAGWLMILAGTL